MIALTIQIAIALFGLFCLYCEISDKYRNCQWHVSVRLFLMIAAIVLAFKASMVALAPILVQVGILFFTLVSIKWLYKKVLKRQMKIKNFKLIKTYLGEQYVKRISG